MVAPWHSAMACMNCRNAWYGDCRPNFWRGGCSSGRQSSRAHPGHRCPDLFPWSGTDVLPIGVFATAPLPRAVRIKEVRPPTLRRPPPTASFQPQRNRVDTNAASNRQHCSRRVHGPWAQIAKFAGGSELSQLDPNFFQSHITTAS